MFLLLITFTLFHSFYIMSINYLNQIKKRNGFGFTGIFYLINNTQKQTTTFKFNHQNIFFHMFNYNL